jgi:hypothetical protein
VASKKLTRTVTVINPDDGNDYTFTPADDLPGWAAELVTNPAAFESDDDYEHGAARDAERNKRGRVRRDVPSPAKQAAGGKSSPAKQAAGESDAS